MKHPRSAKSSSKPHGVAPQAPALPQDKGVQLIALFNAGRYAELESQARLLVKQYPGSGFVWKVLGTALLVQGKEALQPLQQAVALLPDDVQSHCNLGNALKALGRLDEAVASYRQALAINADHVAAHYNLGIALKDLGLPEEAVVSYRKALAIQPDFPDAHYNLGIALHDLGQADEAIKSYGRALALQPGLIGAHCNLGLALKDAGRYSDAVASNERALEIQPDFAVAHNNLGLFLKDLGLLDEAIARFRRTLEIQPDFAEAYSNLLFTQNYLTDQPAQALLAEARRYGELVARQGQPFTTWPNLPDAGRPLRVGLVSGDLRRHPVGYFLEGVLSSLSARASSRLELFAYSSDASRDALTDQIKACCRGWCSAVGMSDQDLGQRIRQDGIDILVDLSGHTAHNRLPMFALKPAPVQVTWLGYFATTGVAAIDYLIADPWTLPESEDAHFTEAIWRLPETRLCFTPPDADVPVSPLPALTQSHITFGCFNNLTKLNDGVVALWAKVLQAVAGSRLLLKAEQFDEASIRQGIIERFALHGIEAQRLTLEGKSSRADYLAAYHQVDIGLDPFPFTGGTTSAESLWMGVPVLTLAGDRLVARQGVSLMMNAGLADWVAADADDYVSRAVRHAADLPGLATLRGALRQQVSASPIFDAPRFADHFEAALRGMWTRWCAHQSPFTPRTQGPP